jgi:hypothetical protein
MFPEPALMTTPLTVALVPSSIPSAPELCAKPDGLVASLELAAPPPIVMSAPDALDCVVLSCVKFASATPPVEPVVQRVIGPPEVPNSLGVPAFVPALPVIRPADLTRIPCDPACRLAFSAEVLADSISKSVALVIAAPTDIAPVRDVKETPPVPEVVIVAEVVTVAQLTVRSAARLIAPLEFAKAPEPEQDKLKLYVDELVSPVETEMFPELSIVTFLAVIAETRSDTKMFVVDAEVAWKTPSTKVPWVEPEAVMFMVVAVKLGVIETEVLMNSSAVILSV